MYKNSMQVQQDITWFSLSSIVQYKILIGWGQFIQWRVSKDLAHALNPLARSWRTHATHVDPTPRGTGPHRRLSPCSLPVLSSYHVYYRRTHNTTHTQSIHLSHFHSLIYSFTLDPNTTLTLDGYARVNIHVYSHVLDVPPHSSFLLHNHSIPSLSFSLPHSFISPYIILTHIPYHYYRTLAQMAPPFLNITHIQCDDRVTELLTTTQTSLSLQYKQFENISTKKIFLLKCLFLLQIKNSNKLIKE